MLWVSAADDANHALALNHLAVLTDRLDAAAYFHKKAPMDAQNPLGFPRGRNSELAFENTRPGDPSQLAVVPEFTQVP
jgi:hypothetical protein